MMQKFLLLSLNDHNKRMDKASMNRNIQESRKMGKTLTISTARLLKRHGDFVISKYLEH
jgi:hypothetical protein